MNATAPAYDFALNSRLSVSLERIGREREPVLIVEEVLQAPESLVDYAATEVAFAPAWGPKGGYPGLRAPAPLNYVEKLVRSLSPVMEKAFGLAGVALSRAECNLSLVTLPPEALAPPQRIPHFDTTDPLQFALLHYLCPPRFGGTAFYRHRATGHESLTAGRAPAFDAVRRRELAELEGEAAYITGHSPHYEQIAAVGARYNRLIVYRSRLLHSGQIGAPEALSEDPRQGRLTANIFLNYRQA